MTISCIDGVDKMLVAVYHLYFFVKIFAVFTETADGVRSFGQWKCLQLL